MFRTVAVLAALAATSVTAQPLDPADPANKAVQAYVYLMDAKGNKVLVNTQFWRNDPKYDERALHRFVDVLAALEKDGFRKNPKAAIDNWDKPEPFARCFIYMEDLGAGAPRKTKEGLVSGSRLWCSENGASEHEIKASDNPKHVNEVLKYFGEYLARAKKNLHQ